MKTLTQTVRTVAALCLLANLPAMAAADYWLGGVSSGNWNSGASWVAGTAPIPFDSLVFTNQSGATDMANNNFAAGTAFDSIIFSNSSAGSAFNLTGNSVFLSGATNGIAIGVTNITSLAETINLNLTSDWGYYTFDGGSGGLALNGTLAPDAGGVVYFGSGVTSSSFTTDANGLITGIDGAGLMYAGGRFTGLATISSGAVSAYGYGGSADQVFTASGTLVSNPNSNVKLNPTATTTLTVPAGASVYLDSMVNVTAATTATISPASGQTLVMGPVGLISETMAGGTSTTKNMITIGGAGALSAGGSSAGPGELIFAVGGANNSGNNIAITDTKGIVDNPAGGAVTVVVIGTGSMYINNNGTYSGGTYVGQGMYLQGNNGAVGPNTVTCFGTGPIYLAKNATLYPNVNGKSTAGGAITFPNNLFLSPGVGTSGSPYGAIKGGNETFAGNVTLMGASTTVPGNGDRIGLAVNAASPALTLSGQLMGGGTLELFADIATGNFLLDNASANNIWTGGLIIDGAANDSSYVKIGANNQLAGNSLTIVQSGTGIARLDLSGYNDMIGGLSGALSANNEVMNSGSSPSILTIGSGNATSTFGGIVGGDSAPDTLSVTKIGTGTLTFNNANTYQGNTLVAGGTLALSGGGSLTSPQITVSNSTFDISAVSGSYAGTSGIGVTNGTFNLGNVPATAVGSLAITNSTLQFAFNSSAISMTVGSLVTGGNTNVISLPSVPGLGTYPQEFPLIKYGGSFANVDAHNDLTNLGVNLPALGGLAGYLTNNVNNGSIDLVLTAGPAPVVPITWNGRTNGVNVSTWDILTTPDWVTTSGRAVYSYQDTSLLTFDDTAAGATTVNLVVTALPGSITFNNTNKNYTLTGTGKISGSTGLTNNGVGTVTLMESGGDNFSGGLTVNSGTLIVDNNSGGVAGGTMINGGTLQVGNNDSNGVLPSGTLTDNGALVFNRSDTALNVATVIAGTGALTNNGTGTVTISAISTFTGPTVANAGTLAFATPNANPSGIAASSGLTINNGATVMATLDNSIGLTPATVPVTINAGGTLTGSGAADGGGGTSGHLGGILTLNGGTLTDGGSQTPNLTYGTWDLDGGVSVPGGPVTSTIGCLNVVPSQAGGTQFNVTNGATPSGIDLLVSGTLINGTTHNDSGIIKNGPGVMALDNNNTYFHGSGTTINDGVLQLGMPGDTAALTSPLGAGAVIINTSSILRFNSSKGVTVVGAIADDGTGIVLVNSGTNILAGANTYTGPTIVNGGTLSLQGAGAINGSISITVSNATFDVSQPSSPVASASPLSLTNSTLNVGTNFISSIGSLAVSNSTLTVLVNAAITNITVTGAFVTGGNTNRVNVTVVPGFPFYPTNIPVVSYGSYANTDVRNSLTNLGLILPALGSPTGYLTNNVASSQIDLVVLSSGTQPIYPLVWNGQTNGVNVGKWDILNTPDWVQSTFGISADAFQNNSPVTFDDTALGTTSVVLVTNVLPAGITVSNASKTYLVSGPGKITGIGGIIKLNTGTATFAEAGGDAFSGGVAVAGGTLVLSNANANISGGLNVSSGSLIDQGSGTETGNLTLNGGSALLDQTGGIIGNLNINSGTVQVGANDANGNLPSGTLTVNDTLIFDRTDTALNVGSVIAGYGTLENNGPGTVALSVTETFTGQVVANGGMMFLEAGNNAAPNGLSAAGQLTINTNSTVAVLVDNSLAGHGAPLGALPITINAGGVLTGAPGADGGLGTSTHIPGLLTLNGGTLANSGTEAQTANGSWDIDYGVATSGGSIMSIISSLNAIPDNGGGTYFTIPAGTTPNGVDLLVNGTLVNGTSIHDTGIIFIGGGTMALDNNNSFRGLTIDAGTLLVGMPNDTNAWTSPLGAAGVMINSAGSTLEFAGSYGATIGNVISDDGLSDALVLIANGTNIFTAADTYTAPTVISNGTLIVNGSLAAASAVTVLGGTLGGSGVVGDGVTNNGTIAPGTSTAIGTLTCSSDVTNSATSITVMKLSTSLSPSNDVLNVGGNFNYAGTLKVVNLGGSFAGGDSFTLFNVTGTRSGIFSATNLPALGGGMTWVTTNLANGVLSIYSTVNTTPTNLVATVSGNTLSLAWPADHTGWRLLVQTNPLSVGLISASNAWSTVTGSTTVDTENITLNRTNGTVFYRMVYP